MRVVFVNPETEQTLLQIDTADAVPNVGDILVMPNNQITHVVQRAFIVEAGPKLQPVDLSKGQPLTVTLQVAVLPLPSSEEVLQ